MSVNFNPLQSASFGLSYLKWQDSRRRRKAFSLLPSDFQPRFTRVCVVGNPYIEALGPNLLGTAFWALLASAITAQGETDHRFWKLWLVPAVAGGFFFILSLLAFLWRRLNGSYTCRVFLGEGQLAIVKINIFYWPLRRTTLKSLEELEFGGKSLGWQIWHLGDTKLNFGRFNSWRLCGPESDPSDSAIRNRQPEISTI